MPGMKATKVEYAAVEDDDEKKLRLHKEKWGFYLKELATWALAPIFIVGAWIFCIVILVGNGWSPAEKDRAWTAFLSITTGAAGLYFGKQLGK